MSIRSLPPRPHLDHLKHEAKALRSSFLERDPVAVARVAEVLGERADLKLTEAQRVLAREYGFPSWAKLRAHVLASRGVAEAVAAFLSAVEERNAVRAMDVLRAEPRIATDSVHVAAVLGLESEVRRLVSADPSLVTARAGAMSGEPLLWLCFSLFHGENAARDDALAATARALLDAGADADTREIRYGVSALYAVTGERYVPRIARMLLDAGANPNDGESLFHAAEHFHEEALELLLRYGGDVNLTGEWGNTPLYFLLRYWNIAGEATVQQGFHWLLAHGADPNVRCGREQETSLHMAARSGQSPDIVRLLVDHGADVHAQRGDGRTPWLLAWRGGFDDVVSMLEQAGATREALGEADLLLGACARGDSAAAHRLGTPELIASLDAADRWLLPDAAFRGRHDIVRAYLAAGFPIDTPDEFGATALHHASIRGHAAIVRDLLAQGADFRIHDQQHHAPPLGWACFGADMIRQPGGDYEGCVRALLEAGARLASAHHLPEHAGVRAVLQEFAETTAPG